MKNYFYLLFITVVLISACGKDKNEIQPNPNPGEVQTGETNKVKFNISSYDIVDFPATKIGQSSNKNIIRSYGLYIFNSAGYLSSYLEGGGIAGDNYFGDSILNLELELSAGQYEAVFLAFNEYHKNDIYFKNIHTPLQNAYAYWLADSSINNILSNENYFYNDYFFQKINFQTMKDTTVNMFAPRITGRLELNFVDISQDTLDPTVNIEVLMVLENFPYGVKFADGSSYDNNSSSQFHFTKKKWVQFIGRPLVINSMPTENSKIQFFIWKNGVEYRKVIENFPIYKNKITRLYGNIYDSSEFGIMIDTNWDGIHYGEF